MKTFIFRPATGLLIASFGMFMGLLTLRADPSTTPAPETPSPTISSAVSQDIQFIKEAARANEAEVALAEIGARKAQNADLKAFCRQMQQDHLQANKQLQPIAQKYGVIINQPVKGSTDHELTKLNEMQPGSAFDKKLSTEFLKKHQQAIHKFESEATKGSAPDTQQYAQTMLPQLQDHLRHAEAVAQSAGVDNTTISSIVNGAPPAVGGTVDEGKTEK